MTELTKCQVTVGTMFTWGCWILGLVPIVLSCARVVDHPWAILGLALIVGGSLRAVLAKLDVMDGRERMAFEMGRDTVRIVRD